MELFRDELYGKVASVARVAGVCALCTFGAVVSSTLYLLCKRYRSWKTCQSHVVLTGKTAIITGANTGIGFETAVDLAKRNARVILACRSMEKGEKAAAEARKRSGNENVVFRQLDLSSLDSVRQFAASITLEETKIDILVNNAGIVTFSRNATVDGFEPNMAVNHLGHFLLTNLLLTLLKEAPSSRIVVVTSGLHEKCETFDFENMNVVNPKKIGHTSVAYCQSKLANLLFVRVLSKSLKDTMVTVNAVHPGFVKTSLGREQLEKLPFLLKPMAHFIIWLIAKSPRQGAQTTLHCAVSKEVEGVTGKYFGNCCEEELTSRAATDDVAAEKLWQVSATLVKL